MDAMKNWDVLKNFDTTRMEFMQKFDGVKNTAVDAVKEFVTDKIRTKVFHKEHEAPHNIILKVTAAAVAAWAWTVNMAKGIAFTVTHPQWPEFCAVGVLSAAIGGMIASFFSDTMKKLRWLFGALAGVSAAIVILRAILRPRD